MTSCRRMTAAGMRARGWTPAMIARLLGEPDALAPNPRYRKAAPMRLYDIGRIEAAESRGAFAEARAAASRRSKTSIDVAERKAGALHLEIKAVTVLVHAMHLEDLIDAAIESYNRRNDRPDSKPVGRWSPIGFLQRIAVNHARHDLTTYDGRLEALFGRIGKTKGVDLIRAATYDAIAEQWPALAKECAHQLWVRTQGRRRRSKR